MVCVRNVCWEGGGVRCLAYAGAWKRMEELGKTSDIERLSGSSGGAIMAVAVAVGYTADEIEKLLRETDMNDFKDGSYTLVGKAWDLIFNFGLYKGNYFYKWIGDIIAVKTGDPDISFQQLQDRYGKDLIITGSNLNRRKLEIYSASTTPNMKVRQAVRISMSIPLFFQPVKMEDEEGTAMLVDGGLMSNYAIDVFHRGGRCCILEETLGFKLLSEGEREDSEIYHGFDKIDSVSKVVKGIVNSMMMQIERLYIKPNYWKRTIAIQTYGVSATDFDMSSTTKDLLYQWGYDNCCLYWDNADQVTPETK